MATRTRFFAVFHGWTVVEKQRAGQETCVSVLLFFGYVDPENIFFPIIMLLRLGKKPLLRMCCFQSVSKL